MNNNEAKQTILESDSCFCKHGAYKDCHSGCKYREALDAAVKALEQEPKTGHWIMSDDGLYRPICNNCGAHPWKGYIPTVEEATEIFKYCPNCGCRMVEPQESEDT